MENKIIVGNIKMNMKFGEIANYTSCLKKIHNKNVIICPSYIYIPYFLNHNYSVGSQDVCSYEGENCTGEVSASQLASIGVSYTIVGHSERRIKLKETDVDINKKVRNSLNNKLKVILCIGETYEELKLLKKEKVLRRQIKDALFGITDLKNIIIAYEPVWSIGSNKTLELKELDSTIKYIKDLVYDLYHQTVKVIYGGSINEDNISKFNSIKSVDGFLIGSASINPNQFIEIVDKIV